MVELTAGDFEAVCRTGEVGTEIGALEGNRKAALKSFWTTLLGGILLSVLVGGSLVAGDWPTIGFFAFIALFVGAIVMAIRPLTQAKEGLKHPVLDALAAKANMEYMPDAFDPPVYAQAARVLFGSSLSSQTFSDLLHGADSEGRGYAVYEANLQRSSGKNTHTVFCGQMYALQHKAGREGITAVVPDKGLFNFFKPASDMQRVKIESDPAFESKFEVYSTHPEEARRLLTGTDLRPRLLELRESGRVFAYIGPDEALVAATGKNKFEPGSMFRSRAGEERVRLMFDDVCASLKVLGGLRNSLS
jgi:hypothetical protein